MARTPRATLLRRPYACARFVFLPSLRPFQAQEPGVLPSEPCRAHFSHVASPRGDPGLGARQWLSGGVSWDLCSACVGRGWACRELDGGVANDGLLPLDVPDAVSTSEVCRRCLGPGWFALMFAHFTRFTTRDITGDAVFPW